MGQMTQARIAAWQQRAGIKPATGECAKALEAMSQAAFEIIKIVELERSGIRDGDGYWHGGDVMGCLLDQVVSAHNRWMDVEERERQQAIAMHQPRAPVALDDEFMSTPF